MCGICKLVLRPYSYIDVILTPFLCSFVKIFTALTNF